MIKSKALIQVVENLKKQVKDQIALSGNSLEVFRGDRMKLKDWGEKHQFNLKDLGELDKEAREDYIKMMYLNIKENDLKDMNHQAQADYWKYMYERTNREGDKR